MASRFSISAVFKGIDKISQPVSRMANRIKKFTRRSDRHIKKLGKSFRGLGKTIGKVTKTAAIVGVGALSFALIDAGKNAVSFEQTMVNAAAKFGPEIQKGTREFKLLSEAARKTGKETEFTAVQSAQALNFLAMAGFNARQSIAALPGVVDLATAAQVDLATATDIATDTLGAMGLATKDPIQLAKNLARVNDVLAKTTTTANTNMEQMFEAIVAGGADFTAAGQSIESFAALVGIMASNGKKGEAAGTALRNVMVRLAAPSKEAGTLIRRLGIRTADQAGNFRDVVDILADVEKSVKGMGSAQRTATISTIFGLRAQGAINILLKAGSKNINDYRKQLLGAEGASKVMATTMRDTLQGQINSLISAFEGLGITVFTLNNGAFSKFIDKGVDIIRTIEKAIAANEDLGESIFSDIISTMFNAAKAVGILIAGFLFLKTVILVQQAVMLGFGAVMGIVKVVMFAYSIAMKSNTIAAGVNFIAMLALKGLFLAWKVVLFAVTAAQWLFNIALNANPIGLIVVAVGLLIAAGAALIIFWEPISDFFVGMWDSISNAFSNGIGFVMGLIEPFLKTISGIKSLAAKFGMVFSKEEKTTAAPKTGIDFKNIDFPGRKEEEEPEPFQMVSPAERVSRSIEETTSESKSTLTIRDETGRAELQEGQKNRGVKLKLATSGGF